jgi:hypothetical protein
MDSIKFSFFHQQWAEIGQSAGEKLEAIRQEIPQQVLKESVPLPGQSTALVLDGQATIRKGHERITTWSRMRVCCMEGDTQ